MVIEVLIGLLPERPHLLQLELSLFDDLCLDLLSLIELLGLYTTTLGQSLSQPITMMVRLTIAFGPRPSASGH